MSIDNPKNPELDNRWEEMKNYNLDYIVSLEGALIKKIVLGRGTIFSNVYLQIRTPRPGTTESELGYNIRVYDPDFGVRAWCKIGHINQIEL